MTPPRRRVRWRVCYRIIPSRFPPVDLFERVADAADLAAIHELESLTNERLRDESGVIHVVPSEERATGPGSGYVMASFAHAAAGGARFSDASFGAYYAAHTMDTAVAETVYHRERFLRATREAPLELDMRVLEAELDGRLHDLRGQRTSFPGAYDPDDYGASQRLAARLRREGSDGIVYDSVRDEGGVCAVIFRPRRVRGCRATMHLAYVWDGNRIEVVYEKREYRPTSGARRPAG